MNTTEKIGLLMAISASNMYFEYDGHWITIVLWLIACGVFLSYKENKNE